MLSCHFYPAADMGFLKRTSYTFGVTTGIIIEQGREVYASQ
jgi:hypothetical protein